MSELTVSGDKLLIGRSLVNKYDLLALEQSIKGLTEERILLAFQAFDELIPNLGVFTRIFQKLRGDLFDAVYSDELTGTAGLHDDENSEYIQRLPYFSLVRQVYNERNELAEALKGQLDIVQERLFDKQKLLEEAQETISDKEGSINALNSIKKELEIVIENKNKQITELKDELENTIQTFRSKEHNLICDIGELRIRHFYCSNLNTTVVTTDHVLPALFPSMEALEEAKNEINFLSQFKKGYDDLHNAFMDKKDTFEGEPQTNKKSLISTKRSNLMSDIESGHKLEEQIMTVMNISIEEYDKFIEGYKFTLVKNVAGDRLGSVNQNLQELDLVDQELENFQENFQNSTSNLLTELRLLQQHNTMLADKLQKFEKIKPEMSIEKTETDPVKTGKFCLYDHLVEMQAEELNPFIPHESVFSKYAAMLFTSNDHGKTFEELGDTSFCVSCGEKTLVCPHKIHGPEKIFILPVNSSHIKLTRPKVRINKQFMMYAHSKPSTKSAKKITSNEDGNVHMIHNMLRLWDNYKQRTKIERAVPRPLDLERARSMMEQFLGYLIWTDEFLTDKEANLSILDTFYCFMHSRYLLEDVMYLAAHDFLSAMMNFSEVDKMIQMFGHVLSGNLDASCLRYILLMFDFISAVTWKEVEDFRPFSSVVYPFLNEDEIESLQMSYTSYSENKISSYIVCSFIINIIQKNQEPRFQNLENKLAGYKCAEKEQLSNNEFKEALDCVLPLCNELTRRRLYLQSERAVEWDGIVGAVPIMRLAQISGYLELHQINPMVKEHIAQRIYNWRERPKSGATALNQVAAAVVPETTSENKLPTMGYMKQFAANLNRHVRQREERKLHDVTW